MTQDLNSQAPSFQVPKALVFLSMLYLLCDIGGPILGRKVVMMPWGIMLGSTVFGAICSVLEDVIAEVYGYKIARQIFVTTLLSSFIFALLFYFILYLKSPPNWNGFIHYNFVFSQVPFREIWALFATIISWRINIYLLLKWKFLLAGKYFFLRTIGASLIGTILFIIFAAPVTIILKNVHNLHELISLVCWSFLSRMTLIILISYPGQIIVNIIRAVEHIEVFAKNTKFHNDIAT